MTKEKFLKEADKIKHILWLNHWDINISFSNKLPDNVYGRLESHDKSHKQAEILFNWDIIKKEKNYKLYIIHEMLHIYLHVHNNIEYQEQYFVNRI